MAEIPSVGRISRGSVGSRFEILINHTPRKIVMKPHRRDIVLMASVVLKPWKRMKEARRTAVVKET